MSLSVKLADDKVKATSQPTVDYGRRDPERGESYRNTMNAEVNPMRHFLRFGEPSMTSS